MTTAYDVIGVARSQLGYVEQGGAGNDSGNITKYWAELDPPLQGQSWCAAFVSWCFKHAGAPLPAMDRPYGYMNVGSLYAYAKAHGLFDASGHYEPGDVLIYGVNQHTGIVLDDDGVTITAIEGNTSPDGSAGSQTNGGAVCLRHRSHGDWVTGVFKASRLLAGSAAGQGGSSAPVPHPAPVPVPAPAPVPAPKPAPKPASIPPYPGLLTQGASGAAVRTLQARLAQRGWRITVDGDFGPATASVVRAFQQDKHLTVDGKVGPQTWSALWSAPITR